MDAPQQKVVVCPLCAKAVRYYPEQEDADTAFARHTASGCDPQNYGKVHNKPRCPVPSCKERLTAVNTYKCRDCGTEVCLSKHRYNPKDHACAGRPVAGPTAAAKQQLGSLLRGLRMNDAVAAVTKPAVPAARSAAAPRQQAAGRASHGTSSGGVGSGGGGFFARAAATIQGWRGSSASAADPATTVRGLTTRRQQQQQQQQQQEQQQRRQEQSRSMPAGAVSAQHAQSAGRPVEVCADCGRRFDTVSELITHYEVAHAEAAAQSPS